MLRRDSARSNDRRRPAAPVARALALATAPKSSHRRGQRPASDTGGLRLHRQRQRTQRPAPRGSWLDVGSIRCHCSVRSRELHGRAPQQEHPTQGPLRRGPRAAARASATIRVRDGLLQCSVRQVQVVRQDRLQVTQSSVPSQAGRPPNRWHSQRVRLDRGVQVRGLLGLSKPPPDARLVGGSSWR